MKKMLLLIGITKVAPALLGLLIIGGVMLVPKVASWLGFEKDQPQIEAATWDTEADPDQDTDPDESPDSSPDAGQKDQTQPSWTEDAREYVFEQFKNIPDMDSNFKDVEDHVRDIQGDAEEMREEAEKLYEQASELIK
jgi:hypothetical protein